MSNMQIVVLAFLKALAWGIGIGVAVWFIIAVLVFLWSLIVLHDSSKGHPVMASFAIAACWPGVIVWAYLQGEAK